MKATTTVPLKLLVPTGFLDCNRQWDVNWAKYFELDENYFESNYYIESRIENFYF